MSVAVPAWQTEELVEEWVESSPSPPTSPHSVGHPPQPSAPFFGSIPSISQASVNAKRGSLRMLGHSAPRALPPPRKPTNPVDMKDENTSTDRIGSKPLFRNGSGIPSPPTSRSSSESSEKRDAAVVDVEAGTMVIKPGEENIGKAFPRNPFAVGLKGGKDIFGQIALERMFEPPSPPTALVIDETQQSSILPEDPIEPVVPQSTTPPHPPSSRTLSSQEPRRASHAYAPANPSRLSKSVTPSSNDSFSSESATNQNHSITQLPEPTTEIDYDKSGEQDSSTQERSQISEDASNSQHDEIEKDQTTPSEIKKSLGIISGQVETDLSPVAPRPDYPFTFSAPSGSAKSRPNMQSGAFEPSLEPLANGEPSHSTLNHRPSNPLQRLASANPALRLFRSTYDTYTREHLSAIVDSIAIEASPSPHSSPSIPDAMHLRQWSPSATESEERSDSRSRSDISRSVTPSSASDNRSSKRLRLSPPSPKRYSRDWNAQGRAIVERMKHAEISSTSASQSSSSESRPNYDGDFNHLPPTPPLVTSNIPTNWPKREERQHRSNPSTASSNYLRQAEDLMARIKSRVVSDTASGAEASPVGPPGRRILSETSDNITNPYSSDGVAGDHENGILKKSQSRGKTSPRRMLRRLSASEEIKRVAESTSSGDDEPITRPAPLSGSLNGRNNGSRPGSRTSVVGAGLPPSAPFNPDDLNRYISSSTIATATTAVSTSFVKHSGPKAGAHPHGGGIRIIKPDDVQGVVPDRIGNMRFDQVTKRWVRDAKELGKVDEAGESKVGSSEESIDIFAGIDSMGGDESNRGTIGRGGPSSIALTNSKLGQVEELSGDDLDLPVIETLPPLEPTKDVSLTKSKSKLSPTTPPAAMSTPRPQFTHTVSAPELHTPAHAVASFTPNGASNPLRSALRNPQIQPASAIKKRAAWHEDLTPRPVGPQGNSLESFGRRSVSFSDGKKPDANEAAAGGGAVERSRKQEGVDLFGRNGNDNEGNISFLPSAKTNRIQGMLNRIEDLSLEDDDREGTPSKPSKIPETSSHHVQPTYPPSPGSDDDTIPLPTRSFRSCRSNNRSRRHMADATFLTECSFGVAHDRLVQLITDVQPFEPYWEQLKTIDLSKRGVESLARLKEFLPVLDEAILNDNEIDYLSGIPSSVRKLHVAGNRLTSLTSVNHLRNIQYLDISRNQLDSVTQLECLKHLRELKADKNMITDLTGIMKMDCLIKLSCSGNEIARLDLSSAQWDKLESIDLSSNKIALVRDLHRLTSIHTINLDDNCLTSLELTRPMTSVRMLRISDNELTRFDMSNFPKLRTFFVDNNKLQGLARSGVSGGRLENLSIRNQRVKGFRLSLEDFSNIKRLYISGNPLTSDFLPSTPLFALVYLEAAACSLSTWPTRLSERIPNLRVININYNYFDTLDGLAGLSRLRKVMAIGMRVGGGAKGAVKCLKTLPALEQLDMRMNPSTLSFYLPLILQPSSNPTRLTISAQGSTSTTTEQREDANVDWVHLDAQFRKSLPDEWYSKRLVYRGLIMAACDGLEILDGVKVERCEKEKAMELIARAMKVVDLQ